VVILSPHEVFAKPLPGLAGRGAHRWTGSLAKSDPASDDAERWRPVVGYSGYYEVSSWGRIRGVERRARTCNQWGEASRTVPPKILRPKYRGARVSVQLSRDGVQETCELHTLVLQAFVGPRPKGHYARHVNDDPADCGLSNLQWTRRNWGGQGRKLKAGIVKLSEVGAVANHISLMRHK
jgi:NUMOD4 motif/HNH endonuclease